MANLQSINLHIHHLLLNVSVDNLNYVWYGRPAALIPRGCYIDRGIPIHRNAKAHSNAKLDYGTLPLQLSPPEFLF